MQRPPSSSTPQRRSGENTNRYADPHQAGHKAIEQQQEQRQGRIVYKGQKQKTTSAQRGFRVAISPQI